MKQFHEQAANKKVCLTISKSSPVLLHIMRLSFTAHTPTNQLYCHIINGRPVIIIITTRILDIFSITIGILTTITNIPIYLTIVSIILISIANTTINTPTLTITIIIVHTLRNPTDDTVNTHSRHADDDKNQWGNDQARTLTNNFHQSQFLRPATVTTTDHHNWTMASIIEQHFLSHMSPLRRHCLTC